MVAAVAIVLALVWTTAGYLRGRLGLGGREEAQAELARAVVPEAGEDDGERRDPPPVEVAS